VSEKGMGIFVCQGENERVSNIKRAGTLTLYEMPYGAEIQDDSGYIIVSSVEEAEMVIESLTRMIKVWKDRDET
jgi:hypothetical protein